MTTRDRDRRGRKNALGSATDAQASALGFIIVLGILLSATAIYFSTEIPQWTANYEFEHALKVRQDFANLGATIDIALMSEDPTASSSIAIGMAPESVQLAGIFATGGSIHFDPYNETFACIAARPDTPAPTPGSRFWNSTPANFTSYEKFHVATSTKGAELELIKREDKTFFNPGSEVYFAGEYWYNNFTVSDNTKLITTVLAIHAVNIMIKPGSSVSATSFGMAGGKKDQDGFGNGGGLNSGNYSDGGGGAGYGGGGGDGGARCASGCGDGGAGGSTYGNSTSITVEAGSGGAGGSSGRKLGPDEIQYDGGSGGDGGGSIHLDASTVTVSGTISVDGLPGKDGSKAPDSAGGGGGGGSGGTILIQGYNVTITSSGKLYARGGNGGNGGCAYTNQYSGPENNGGGGGGGAGGRIKVVYENVLIASGGFASRVDVSRGTGGSDTRCGYGSYAEDGAPGNPGTNVSITDNYTVSLAHYTSGYLTSTAYDVGDERVRYGTLTWNDEPKESGTNIAFKVRTAITANMSGALPWEECQEVTNGQDISELYSVSDGHRYVQWRAEFLTFDRSRTPRLKSVNLTYEYGIPSLTNVSGCIRFDSQYLYQGNQRLVHAQGATIAQQLGGNESEFMLFPPPIQVARNQNGSISLVVSSVDLTGESETISGTFVATARASYQDSYLAKKGLPFLDISFALNTAYPTAWKKWFNETCEAAGLSYGAEAGKYSYNESGNNLYVIFHGNATKPVTLGLKNSKVKIDLM